MNDYEKTLEFDHIIADLAECAHSEDGKKQIFNLEGYDSLRELNMELDKVFEALLVINKLARPTIPEMHQFSDVLSRIRLEAFLAINDFISLSQFLGSVSQMMSYFRELKSLNIDLVHLEPYFSTLIDLRSLSVDLSMVFGEDFEIKDNASLALNDIRKKIKLQESSLRNKINELLTSKAKMLNDHMIVYRNQKMCLPVKVEYKNQFKGQYHGESASKTTVYIEPIETLEISNHLEQLREQEKDEIAKILMNLSIKMWPHYDNLKMDYDIIISLDVLFAKGLYAKKNDCIRPKVNNNGQVNLIGAKHPLIDKDICVPIDIKLGYDYDAMIITGPNTGGKTVSLKTIGLLSVMTKYGLLIPAKEGSEVALFDNVYADIDNVQSIEQSLSSFSANIKHVKEIIEDYITNSLVLFDELGSGTDPKEGSNLAISIIDYLLKRKAKIICTTHYSDLKVYAYKENKVINASVEFDNVTLKPTYRLLVGVSGSSNALTIAKRLGLKEEIIENAVDLERQGSEDVSSLMKRLEDTNVELNRQKNIYIEKENEYIDKLNELNKRESDLVEKQYKFEREAKDKALKIIENAKEEAKDLLDELKQALKEKDLKTNEFADLSNKVNRKFEIKEENIVDYEFKVGDTVTLKTYNTNGTIERIKKGRYDVKMGNITINVDKDELLPYFKKEEIKKKQLPKEVKNHRGMDELHNSYKLELDLRGYRYEEVKPALELFIDQAYLAHVHQVYVIHGYGTGAVRKACYDYFKKSPYVKETRFGGQGEGLNGVTVVILK